MRIEQAYELVSLDDDEGDVLKEHPKNPRRGAVEAIDESIEINGWFGAVTAQKSTGYILAGNHRYRVAVARGAKEIPVIWMSVDDETALRILLADNRTADLGTYDEETLSELLSGLETLDGTGYGLMHLEAEMEATDTPEADGPPGPDDVPDDRYEPQFAVILMVDTEDDQADLYAWLQDHGPEGGADDTLPVAAKMKVVAV